VGSKIPAVHPCTALQLRDPQLQPGNHLGLTLAGLQHRAQGGDLSVLGLCHLSQPGVGRAQGRQLITGRRRVIGHKPPLITTCGA
jgi:hypothetical protein